MMLINQIAVKDETPYWFDPNQKQISYAVKSLPKTTDVLIIGGGYTGISTALRLRHDNVRVILVDGDRLCFNASARNGGMALTGLNEGIFSVVKRFGTEKTRQYFNASLDSVDCVERLVNEGNIDCHFHRYGNLVAAYKPSHYKELVAEQTFSSEVLNYETRLVAPNDMKSEIGSSFYHGGLIDPLGVGLHPAKYIAGLVKMADAAGAELHERVAAQRIEKRHGGFRVRTTSGTIETDHVVVATNGYTGNIVPWLQRRMIPVESFMIATEVLPQEISEKLIPNGRMIFDTKNFLYYFRLSPDGQRMLFGGRPRSPRFSIQKRAEFMRQDMLQVYPQLKPFNIEYAWFGNCGFTFDRFPHIGQHDGLFYAMGYCGHGIAMATYLGEEMAKMILGEGDGSIFAENPFVTVPFYRGKPWFKPLLHLYFDLMDRLPIELPWVSTISNLYFRGYERLGKID